MPQTRRVILNYASPEPGAPFGPMPRETKVKPNDTIEFTIGEQTRVAHPGCKLRITLHRDTHFSRGVLQHGPGQAGTEALTLTVRPDLAAAAAAILAQPNRLISGYKCELLDANGQPLPGLTLDGANGGEIVPDTSPEG